MNTCQQKNTNFWKEDGRPCPEREAVKNITIGDALGALIAKRWNAQNEGDEFKADILMNFIAKLEYVIRYMTVERKNNPELMDSTDPDLFTYLYVTADEQTKSMVKSLLEYYAGKEKHGNS